MLGFLPGFGFAVGDNRPERDAEADITLVFRRFGAHPLDGLAGLRQRLAPQGEDVGMFAGDGDGRFRRAAKIDRKMRFLQRANGGPGLLGLIEIVVNIHRLLAGPHLAHGVEEGVGAGVALVVVEIIAIPALLGIVAAADDMHRQAAPQQVLKGGEFARGKGWGNKTGAMGQQVLNFLRRQPGQGRHQKAVGLIGPVADQQTIKPGGFMGLRKANDIVAVKDRPHRGNRFGREAVANHAEKLNAHEQLLASG